MATTDHTHTTGFQYFATRASQIVGSKWAFTFATLIIVLWCATGPYFHYSDTWQLVVNTATTTITFLICLRACPQ